LHDHDLEKLKNDPWVVNGKAEIVPLYLSPVSETLPNQPPEAALIAIEKEMAWEYDPVHEDAKMIYSAILKAHQSATRPTEHTKSAERVAQSAAIKEDGHTVRSSSAERADDKHDETMGDAAHAFVEDMVKREKYDYPAENACGWGYLWHGWALRDAFYAGVRWAEARPSATLTPLEKLALDMLAAFREIGIGDIDGGWFQDTAEKLGVLVPTEAREPCGEACGCAELGDFPQICYRDSDEVHQKRLLYVGGKL
jgi:hypothetical protein